MRALSRRFRAPCRGLRNLRRGALLGDALDDLFLIQLRPIVFQIASNRGQREDRAGRSLRPASATLREDVFSCMRAAMRSRCASTSAVQHFGFVGLAGV